MRYAVFLIFILLIIISCSGARAPEHKSTPALVIPSAVNPSLSVVGNKIPAGLKIEVFDGVGMKELVSTDGKAETENNITDGLYGIVFFSMKGYHPEVTVFKSTGGPQVINAVPLKKMEYSDMGVLTGVVYKPVSGGKIKKHMGISSVSKNLTIEINKAILTQDVKTDEKGIYRILLFPGEYALKMNGKKVDAVKIEAGMTTIKNIQRGIVLVD